MGKKSIISGTVIGFIVLIAAWLMWPLPDPEFDWRDEVWAEAEFGSCFSLMLDLFDLAPVAPQEVRDFLENSWRSLPCADAEPDLMSAIEQGIEAGEDQQELRETLFGSVGPQFMLSSLASERLAQRRFPFAAKDLVFSYRCSAFYSHDIEVSWYQLRLRDAEDDSDDHSVRSTWLRRINQCTALVESYLSEIDRTWKQDLSSAREWRETFRSYQLDLELLLDR